MRPHQQPPPKLVRFQKRRADAIGPLVWLVARGAQAVVWLHFAGAAAVIALRVRGGTELRLSRAVAAFAPFWAADCVAVATQLRSLLRVAALRLHSGVPSLPPTYGSLLGASAGDALREDALPLVRRGVVGVVASVPALCGVAFAQAQLCGALAAASPRRRARLEARACVAALALQGCAVVACALIKRRGARGRLGAALHALLWFAFAGALLRLDGTVESAAWALAPLWLARGILIGSLGGIARRARAGVDTLARRQGAALGLCVCCCTLTTAAEIYFFTAAEVPFAAASAAPEDTAPADPGRAMLHGAALALLRRSASRDEAWAACFVLGLGCGAAAVHLALGMHASQLYHSRGHARPTPLAKDRDGHWVPSGEVQAFWCLLGSFSTTAEEPRPGPAACEPCALCVWARGRPTERPRAPGADSTWLAVESPAISARVAAPL